MIDLNATISDAARLSDSIRCPPADRTLLEQLLCVSRNIALEEMASGIAHELNQPLGAIVTYAQAGARIVELRDNSPISAREVFELIGKEALTAAAEIQRMRRLFYNATPVKMPCSISDVLDELLPLLKQRAISAAVTLAVEIDAGLPRVNIDCRRIQHVLLTLLQNAFDACDIGQRDTAAAVRIEVHGDRYGVEVSVFDCGRGIDEAHRPQLFHPFFTTKPDGTGLGLTSARTIIEAHEGSIGFESPESTGTRVWFRLPACEEQ